MSNRKAFNFLRSYYDVLEDIYDDKDKLTYLMAILDKQFKGIEPELTGIPKLCYKGQKHSIDKSVEGWESKTGEKLSTPYEDPTEGGSQDPTEGSTEGSYQHPSNSIVMTTEGSTEDPYLQEQEQEEEKEEEQEEQKEKEKEEVKLKKEDIVSINYIIDSMNCSFDEALDIFSSTNEYHI